MEQSPEFEHDNTADPLTMSISAIRNIDTHDAELLWTEYFPRLVKYAKTRIRDWQRATYDEEDAALNAIDSYIRGVQKGRFDRGSSSDELWKLLVTITSRKISNEHRRQSAQKRGGQEMTFRESAFTNQSKDQSNLWGLDQVMDENQMPESASQIVRCCESLFAKLANPKLKQTAMLRMEGYTREEIAQQMNCSVSRVKQRIRQVRELWSQEYQEIDER